MDFAPFNELLTFIYRAENGGRIDYDVVYGGIKREHRPARPITTMTVGEVLDWQDSIDPLYPSEAAGALQVMEDTLRGLYRTAGVALTDLFDVGTQDRLAVALLKRRGLDDYLAGRITDEKFANALAREWASLPVVSGPKRGRSYYGGDGLNAAHAEVEPFLAAVRTVRQDKVTPEPDPRQSQLQSTTQRAAAGAQAGNLVTAFQVLPQLDGTTQLLAMGGFILIGLGLLWIMRERSRKWAEGDR